MCDAPAEAHTPFWFLEMPAQVPRTTFLSLQIFNTAFIFETIDVYCASNFMFFPKLSFEVVEISYFEAIGSLLLVVLVDDGWALLFPLWPLPPARPRITAHDATDCHINQIGVRCTLCGCSFLIVSNREGIEWWWALHVEQLPQLYNFIFSALRPCLSKVFSETCLLWPLL